MPVADPRVGELYTRHQVGLSRARSRPQPECTVDVKPGATVTRHLCDRSQIVEGAGIHVSRLGADDRGAGGQSRHRVDQSIGVHGPVFVGRHLNDRLLAEPEQTQAAVDRGVTLRPGHHRHLGCALEPVSADIPALVAKHGPTARGQPHRIAPLGAGHEADGGSAGYAEQILEPASCHILESDGGRGRHLVERHLVPTGGDHVCRQRRICRSADHEAEVPRSGGCDQAGPGGLDQLNDHVLEGPAVLGHLGIETRPHLITPPLRPHPHVGQGFSVIGDQIGRPMELIP